MLIQGFGDCCPVRGKYLFFLEVVSVRYLWHSEIFVHTKYTAPSTVFSRKKNFLSLLHCLVRSQFIVITFMFPKHMRILGFPNAAIVAVSFPSDVKSSLVTETRLTE
jgi:hypothetical protein